MRPAAPGAERRSKHQGPPVASLPDELLAAVFACLDARTLLLAVPLVCSRWRRACTTERVRAHVDLGFIKYGAFTGSAPFNQCRCLASPRCPPPPHPVVWRRRRVPCVSWPRL